MKMLLSFVCCLLTALLAGCAPGVASSTSLPDSGSPASVRWAWKLLPPTPAAWPIWAKANSGWTFWTKTERPPGRSSPSAGTAWRPSSRWSRRSNAKIHPNSTFYQGYKETPRVLDKTRGVCYNGSGGAAGHGRRSSPHCTLRKGSGSGAKLLFFPAAFLQRG